MGEDGSEQFLGMHDRELGIDCSFQRIDDTFRCLPQPLPFVSIEVGVSSYWTDSGCQTSPLVPDSQTYHRCSGNLRYATLIYSECGVEQPIIEIEEADFRIDADSPPVYARESGTGCLPLGIPERPGVFHRARVVDPAEFAAAELVIE